MVGEKRNPPLPSPAMLQNRWSILALIFLVRIGMGLQFQAVPTLAPLYLADYHVGITDIGLLIGLYFAPGVLLALPGGAIGQRYGDKSVVLLGLALMIAGGLLMAFDTTWTAQLIGRLIAGIGGILLNVLMSKMITDWFAGKEIATAMGIYVNSWPFGIALALVTLPWLASAGGLQMAMLGVTAYLALGFVALATLYGTPPAQPLAIPGQASRPEGRALLSIVTAGTIWAFYNSALAMVFGFGPLMLTQRGWTVAAASSAISIVLWLATLSVPAGGILADRTGRPSWLLVGGTGAFAIGLLIAPRADNVVIVFVALGLLSGLAAGPIMSLPARVLTPATRAVGMGIFFTVFYAMQLIAPWLAGKLAASDGSASITFDFGATLLGACLVLHALFWKFVTPATAAKAAA